MNKEPLLQKLLDRAPLLPVMLSVIIGILLFTLDGLIFWLIVAGLSLLSLVLIYIKKSFILISLAGGTLTGCMAMLTDDYINRCSAPIGIKSEVTGTIERISESEHSFRLLLKLNGVYEGTSYVTVTNPEYGLRVGDIICFNSILRSPECRKDVSEQETLERFFFMNHVARTALVNGSNIEIIGENKSLKYKLLRLRGKVVDMIARSSLSQSAQGLLSTLLVGDDALLFDGSREKYSGAGVAHVLALSGMHVAVLVMIGAWILFPVSFLGYHRSRWTIIIITLWFYALMTGMSPSVVRAVMMFSLIIIARYSGQRHSSLNALCLAALIIVIPSPRSLFSAGFQLTFVATAALISIPVIMDLNFNGNWRGMSCRIFKWLWFYLIFTLAATVGSILLSVYWFHRVPLFFLLTNIPCCLLLPPILAVGIMIIVLQGVGIEWNILTNIEDLLCNVIDRTVSFIYDLPGHEIDDVYISPVLVVLGYIALAALAGGIYNRNKLTVLGSIVVLLLVPYCNQNINNGDKLFISRSSQASSVIYTRGRDAFVFTTAPDLEKVGLAETLKKTYGKFFGIRGIKNISLLNPGSIKCGLLNVGDYRILVVNDDEIDTVSVVPDYTLIGAGFKGDIIELSKRIPSDTILLGIDINGRRRKRYFRELSDAGIGVRDLGDEYGLELLIP